jgi:N-acetylneuraminate synthase/N,N'-diacetyllegionaminate synthase
MPRTSQLKAVSIAGREIAPGHSVYIIAEAGVNHCGEVELAKRLIDASVDAGADAVKFQTYRAERLASADAGKAAYQVSTTGSDETHLEMLRQLELPADAFTELARYCDVRGITFLSTPFDEESVDLLSDLGVPAFKISSGDLTNIPFLRYVAAQQRPVILSTGMASVDEVADAVACLRNAGCESIVVLHCVSSYPADPSDANLRAMATLRTTLNVPVGFSDHTIGSEVAIAAVALGACVIEKHLTTDHNLPGPDHRSSMIPADFAKFCQALRVTERALGDGVKRPVAGERDVAMVARRSLYTARELERGHQLTEQDLAARRPGTGISVARWDLIIGRRLARPVAAAVMLSEEDLA